MEILLNDSSNKTDKFW